MAKRKVPSQASSGAETFSDFLVGRQITDGSSALTNTVFALDKSIPDKDSKNFTSNPFSQFLTLDTLKEVEGIQTTSPTPRKKRTDEVRFKGNKKYADRMGNGNEASGDGWKYRGRGALQLTGKANYQVFADYLKKPEIMTSPDLVSTIYAFESAMFFFDKNKLWSICDKGVNDTVILELTKRINGGTHGLEDRKAKTVKYYSYVKA